MLSTLLKSKKSKAPPPLHPNTLAVSTLEAEIAAAQEQITATQKYCNTAFLEATEGGKAAEEKANAARGKLAECHAKLDSLTGALLAARQRETARVEDAANAANSEAWAEAEKLSREYVTAAVKIETTLINLADAYRELTRLSDDLLTVIPVRSGHIVNAGFGPQHLEKAFRLFAHKLGFQWAAQYPYNKADIPAFSDGVKHSVKVALALKSRASK